jgi:hypothetical protein
MEVMDFGTLALAYSWNSGKKREDKIHAKLYNRQKVVNVKSPRISKNKSADNKKKVLDIIQPNKSV